MNDSAADFRRSARELLQAESTIARLRQRGAGANPRVDRAAWQRITQAGWLSVLVPEALGGLGLGLRELTAIVEETGRQLLPEPLVAAGVLPTSVLSRLESERARSLLDAVVSGDRLVAVAWQEQPGTLDAAACSLAATRKHERLHLHGSKRFVVPGAGADGFIVSARDGDAFLLCWVSATTPGLSIDDAITLEGSSQACLSFEDVVLAPEDQLARGETAEQALTRALELARIAQGAELLGVARGALELTLEQLRTRVQFGRPIGSFQALQHRTVDAYIQIELAAASLAEGLDDIEREPAALARQASRIKARCAHAARLTSRLAIQLHGAIGYTDEHSIGLYFKRALAAYSWLGAPEAHRARYLALSADPAPIAAPAIPPPPQPSAPREFPRTADWEHMPEAEFRQLVRAFLQQHYPPQLRHLPHRVHWAPIREWYLTLSRQGWIAPAWPRAFGGMVLPPDKLLAWIEENEQFGVARPPDQGLIMLGPVLMRFGTHDQQQRYLPKILSGEHVWCQGYSEPNAGSDLAALRTEAVLQGHDFIVNGQKTWITLAQDATHMFMLVRSAKLEKKQQGISFLLVDLAAPGITVRPIRNLTGDEEFCEVFFDNVRVPKENLVGELHQGWAISKALLGFERIFGGSPKNAQYALGQLQRVAQSRALFGDAAFRARYAEVLLDTADLAAAYAGFAAIARAGHALPAGVSLLKIWATETHERIALLLTEAAAESAAEAGSVAFDTSPTRIHVSAPIFSALAATIFSGSNEIQRNILARQVLDLPS